MISRFCEEDKYVGTIFLDRPSGLETTETELIELIEEIEIDGTIDDGAIEDDEEETINECGDGKLLADTGADKLVDEEADVVKIGGRLLVNELNRSHDIDLFTNSVNFSIILHLLKENISKK